MAVNVPSRADTVVIGGGIMGASIAWQLARRGLGRTVLLERDLIAAGASGRTGALLRQHYTNVPEATLAARSLTTFRNWNEIVGGSCGFAETGLIVTMPTGPGFEDNIPRMRGATEQLRSLGVSIEMVDAPTLAQIDPAARFDDVGWATWESQSGYVDAIAATRSMASAAANAGAEVIENVETLSIVSSGSHVTGLSRLREKSRPIASSSPLARGRRPSPAPSGSSFRSPPNACRSPSSSFPPPNRPLA
ncbi:MAG: FAD-dependent oxidoreductase [Thermomicrobiales bacterium]